MDKKEGNKKVYSVMFFDTGRNIGTTDKPNVWVNTVNHHFDDVSEALNCYANTPCEWSEFIDAEDEYSLQCKEGEKILEMMDEGYLNENVYPYIL